MEKILYMIMCKNKMKKYLFFLVICLCIYSCSKREVSKECVNPLGKLLVDKNRIEWGDILLGREYRNVLKIYNPTKKDILLKICNQNSEFYVSKVGDTFLDLIEDGFIINPNKMDSLQIIFSPNDLSLLGNYFKGINMVIDEEILVTPIEQIATIFENFDTLSFMMKFDTPIIEVEKDTFNFGHIKTSDNVNVSFIVKNKGNRDLIIRKVEFTCGCINAIIKERVVKPHKSTSLNVTFNPMGKNGRQYKQLRIFCNDPKHSMQELIIKGFVE